MTYRASRRNFQSKNLEYSKLFIYIAIFKTEQQQELVLYISWTFHSKYFLTIWTMCSYFDPIWMWCPLVTETPSVVGVYISFVTHIGAITPISRKWSRCSNLRFLRSWHHLCWIAGDSDGSSFEHFVVQQQLCWRVQGSSIGLMQRDLLRVHFQSGNLMFKVWGPLQSGLNPTFEFLRVHVQSGNIYTASILV